MWAHSKCVPMCTTTKWFCDFLCVIFFLIVENNKRRNSSQSSDMAEKGPLFSPGPLVGQMAEVWKLRQIQLYP